MISTFAPRPTPVGQRPYTFPTFERLMLSNGLRVEHFRSPDRLVSVSFLSYGGVKADPIGREGVGYLTSILRRQGTSTRDGENFAAALDRIGAIYESNVQDVVTVDSIQVPASRLAEALVLLREAVTEPIYPLAEFDRIRGEAIDGIRATLSDPDARANLAIRSVMFAADDRASVGPEGTVASLNQITREDLVSYGTTTLTPQNSVLVIGGNIAGDLTSILKEVGFADWTANGDIVNSLPMPMPISPAPRIRVVDRADAVQTEVRLGTATIAATDPDYAPLTVAIRALGGALDSRLSRVLREEKGYTYGVSAHLTRMPRRSSLIISTPVESTVTADALADLARIIEELRATGLTNDECRRSVDELLLGTALQFQSAASVVDERVTHITAGLPERWFNEHRERIAAVTARSASDAFARLVPTGSLSGAFVGRVRDVLPALSQHWSDLSVVHETQ